MRISDWSSDVCSSDLPVGLVAPSFLSSSPAKTGRVPKGRQGRSAGLVRPAAAGEDTATHALTARRHALRSRRSEEHTSELQSLMRISYAVFCLKKKKNYASQDIELEYKRTKYTNRIARVTKTIANSTT